MQEFKDYENLPVNQGQSMALFRAFISTCADLVLEVDENLSILNCWANNNSILPMPAELYPGKQIGEVFSNSFVRELTSHMESCGLAGRSQAWVTSCLKEGDEGMFHIRVGHRAIAQEGETRTILFISKLDGDIKKSLQEERYSLTVKGINAGIWDWDLRDGTEWWSAKFYELLGYSDQELPSGYDTFVNYLLHPDDRENLLAMGREHRKNFIPYRMDIRLRHKSGTYYWFETFGESLRDKDGHAVRMVGTIINIYAKKEAELTLKESEERFSQVFNYAPIGISLLSPEGNWLQVNRMLCEMLGYSQDDLLGRNYRSFTHPEDLEKNITLTQNLLAGDIDRYEMEKRYIHKDGHTIWVLLRSTLIRDQQGVALYGIAQTLDITKRKEHEAEKENTIQTLNRKNNQLNNFAHIVSHNLRSHSANLQMLNSMYQDSISEEEKAMFIEKIRNIGDSLSRTIEHLGEIVKISQYPDKPMETLYFAPFFKRVKDSVQAEIIKSAAVIHADFSESPALEYPAAYLESIMLNLLTNALKYRIPDRQPDIRFKTSPSQGSILLACSDNGIGINLEKHRKNLFGLYKTFHKHPEARGMGLFLIRNQIENMGGKITVSSEPDKGTLFQVLF
jgi:PAS domain S-box-containing protein